MIGNAGEKSRGVWETGREGRMTKYEIILYWSDEDGAFIAEVPELAGCAADGATRQEALANVETVIAEWLETARELGRPVPEPKGRHSSA
jgi:predicted RNase H-like HicB family nuclease